MDYIEGFLEIEKELGLNERQIDSFYFWNYLRNSLYRKMVDSFNDNGEAFDHYKLTVKKIISSGLNCLFKPKYKMPGKHHDILIMCHPRRVLKGDVYESIYTDFVTPDYDALTVEIPYRGSHFVPAASKGIFYLDHLFASRALSMKMKRKKEAKTFGPEIDKNVNEIASAFKEKLGYEVDSKWLKSTILSLKIRYVYTYRYFTKLLKSVSPKIVLEVVYYNFENMVMNEVCHDLGIKVIEFQHGVTGHNHCAYNYCGDVKVKQLPDETLFFSTAWKDSVRLPSCVERIAVGFNHFDEMRQTYKAKEDRNSIIFISSGTVGDSLSRFAVEINDYMKAHDIKYELIYKLHPGEYSSWKEKYPWLLEAGINVVDNNKVHLYELFSKSVAQIGVYSTAIFEGVGYDLKTYILQNENIAHVDILFRNNAAKLVTKADEVFESIEDNSFKCEASTFWTPDAKSNVFKELDRNLNKG